MPSGSGAIASSARRDFGPGVPSVVRAEALSDQGGTMVLFPALFVEHLSLSLSIPPLTLGQVQSRIPAGYAYIDMPEGDARRRRASRRARLN